MPITPSPVLVAVRLGVRLALARGECQCSAVTEPELDAEPTSFLGPWEALAPSVWRAVAEPDAVNLVLVAGSERALLVDTGSSPEQGRTVRASVAEVCDVPLEVVVVTHAHHDHAAGLPAFADLVTVGHEDVPGPNRPMVLAVAFDLGGRRVEVAHLGRGHTSGDLVVIVPDADLLAVGDLVESAAPPSLGPDSFLQEWPVTVDGVIGLMTGETRAVPGHGDPVERTYVYEQRGRLASVAGEVRRLAESGVTAADAVEQGDWAYPVETLAPGLEAAFAQLGPVTPRRSLPLA
jgi:glyoxylase-like metal-dependent hydrolase (beta-lactamase superfamily II)